MCIRDSSILVSADHENPTIHAKCLDMVYRAEISATLAYFCPNLVAIATALAAVKIQIAYMNSQTPKTLPYMQEVSRYVVQN